MSLPHIPHIKKSTLQALVRYYKNKVDKQELHIKHLEKQLRSVQDYVNYTNKINKG